ncbi:MAG: hypothetical protein MJZ12_00090 [Prevotella sp.]|nr:hypothetical protein [Prevotella sp.]
MKTLDKIMTFLMLALGILQLVHPDVNRLTLATLYFACATLFAKSVDTNNDKEE